MRALSTVLGALGALGTLSALGALFSGPFVPGANAEVTIETDRQFYAPGETVRMTITNGLDEAIEMPSFPPWSVLDAETGQIVAGCAGLPTIHVLDPGLSETYSWDQSGCGSADPVPPGMYWAEVTYWAESTPQIWRSETAPFCLDSGCAPTPTGEPGIAAGSWGSVKGLYR